MEAKLMRGQSVQCRFEWGTNKPYLYDLTNEGQGQKDDDDGSRRDGGGGQRQTNENCAYGSTHDPPYYTHQDDSRGKHTLGGSTCNIYNDHQGE